MFGVCDVHLRYIYTAPGLLAIPLSVPLAHERVVEVLSACENILFLYL